VSEGAPSRARDISPADETVLTHPDAEISTNGDDVLELARDNAVAKQRLVWENRRFVFRSAVVGLVLSVLIAFLIPKRFESSTRLMPPDQEGPGMGLAMLAASSGLGSQVGSGIQSMAGNLLGFKSTSDLFIGILQSRTVQDDLINKFDLRKLYSDRRMEDAREDLAKHTNVTSDRKSGITTILVVDRSPARAAAMAAEYVDQLNRVVVQLNTSSAHRERVFLEERLTQVKQDLESAEKNFSEFAAKNKALDVPTQGRAMIEAAATLEGQLIAAETELQGLKQVYADGNVRVRSVQARVNELRQQLQKSVGDKPANSNTTNAQDRQSLFPSISELPGLGVGYADLYRSTKVQEAVFQTLTQEYELAKVQEAKETPSVKVLDPPNVPEKKSFPPRLLIISVGVMVAVVGSVLWLFGKQSWEATPQEDPQKMFAQEVFHSVRTHVPWFTTNGSGPTKTDGNGWRRFIRRGPEDSQRER